jgi:4-hydroxy-tetrahydrodipicolinate synthase
MIRTPSTFTCTITPFAEDGSLDEDAWRSHIDRLADAGMGVYVGSSSPGEGYVLDASETETLYGIAADTVAGRASARAMGVETHTAAEYLAFVAIAESVGLEAMQIYCVDSGHANTPNDAELEAYFREILDGSSIQCVLSSHVFNRYVVPLDLLDRLLDGYPGRILGVNVTNPDLTYVTRLVETVDGRSDVHVGGPMQALTILALGGQGFLSTDGNIIPKTSVEVIDAHRRGDLAASQAAYRQIMRFFSSNEWPGGSMRFLKASMRALGLPGHHLRPPFQSLDEAGHARVEAILRELDISELNELLGS